MSTPTWDKITGGQGSTTSEFGGNWGNLISDYYNGFNIAITDPTKIPLIGSLTRYKFEKLALFDVDASHYLTFSVDDIDTGPIRKIKFRRMNTPFEEDYAVLEGMPQTILNKTIDADLNTIVDIANASIKTAAGIVYSKLNLSNSIVAGDITSNAITTTKILDANVTLAKLAADSVDSSKIVAGSIVDSDVNTSAAIVTTKLADSTNFILKTLDNAFGAHFQDFTKMTAPANPGANDIRLYVDTTDTHLKIKNNAGTIVDLHTGGGGGATNLDALTDVDLTTTTPVNGDVLTFTSTGTKWIPLAAPGAGGGITASSADTLTNKAINLSNNTVTDTSRATGDIPKDNGTKYVRLARGSANQFLKVNTGGTDIGYEALDVTLDSTAITTTNTKTMTNKTLTSPVIGTIVNTGTLTLPTSTDTLVGRATTDTLTNKTLTTPIISSISNTGTLTLPTSTDTLVGKATTDTFTNKTFNADGTGNSITNIEDADIKAAAAIATTKLADSANFILKTLDNSFGAHYHDITKMTAPANPGANDIRVYVDTADTHLKIKNSAGTVVDLHTGGGGGGTVTPSSTDTFTNKTIDADGTGNVITNIENADIKAAAGIVTTKLADSANFILKTLDNSFGAHYFDITRMTAPGNPTANDGRIYVKQIDTNNDGVFAKIKKAGSFTEIQIL
jgi:hypothetical protein